MREPIVRAASKHALSQRRAQFIELPGSRGIPKKKWMCPRFSRCGLSAFTIQSSGRVHINRSGRIVIREVAFMDKAPDDFHHGLAPVNRGEMSGFADATGRIAVPVKYSCDDLSGFRKGSKRI
jgi:hypothetical protein